MQPATSMTKKAQPIMAGPTTPVSGMHARAAYGKVMQSMQPQATEAPEQDGQASAKTMHGGYSASRMRSYGQF